MESDLKALEDKLSLLIAHCQSLRTENIQLRQDLAQSQSDAKRLKENMAQASTRIEAVLNHLPDNLEESA